MATMKRQALLEPNDSELCEAALRHVADLARLLARQAAQETVTAQASDTGSPTEGDPK